MAPKMEVRDKTFDHRAARQWSHWVTAQNRQGERRAEHGTKPEESLWVKVAVIWTSHIGFAWWQKSNQTVGCTSFLHHFYIILHCCTCGMQRQECPGLSEILLRLTSRTHLWDCRRLQIPRRSCVNVCRFHQHHATLCRSLKLFPQTPKHGVSERILKLWLNFKSGRSWKQESRWKLLCKELWVYKTMTMMRSLESCNFVPPNSARNTHTPYGLPVMQSSFWISESIELQDLRLC